MRPTAARLPPARRPPPLSRGPRPPAAVWPFTRRPADAAVPGVTFVTGDGGTATAADVAALWRDAAPVPGVSGDDEDRVAVALGGTFTIVAAFAAADDGAGPSSSPPTLIGVARIISDGVFAALLSDVAVRPAFRSRGVGRALVAKAVADARARGASSVVAFVPPGRPRLFFTRCGFRISSVYRMLRHRESEGERENGRVRENGRTGE